MGQSLSNAGFAIGESPWLIRDVNGNVVTYIDFDNTEPDSVVNITLTFEYRGVNPIKVLGFYLVDVDPTIYLGTGKPFFDAAEIIRWGDDYTTEEGETGRAGLSVTYKDYDSEEYVTVAFRSGYGDTVNSPIGYNGHPRGILDIDQQMKLTFSIVTPSASEKQITETAKYSLAIDIAFVDIPERLQEILVSNEI